MLTLLYNKKTGDQADSLAVFNRKNTYITYTQTYELLFYKSSLISCFLRVTYFVEALTIVSYITVILSITSFF